MHVTRFSCTSSRMCMRCNNLITVIAPFYILSLISILDLNFNGSLRWVSSNMESSNCIFQFEPMCNERFDVDQSSSHKTNGFGVLLRRRKIRTIIQLF